MLIPLAIGLFIRARYEDAAAKLQPTFSMAANIGLIVLVILDVVLNFSSMIALVGSFGILAGIIYLVLALVTSYLLGGV